MEPQADRGRVGPWRLVSVLGRGSMGTVFEGVDDRTGERAAVKVMAGELLGDPQLVERFRREAQAVTGLPHPNVTRVLGFGEEAERLYMAMELLEGSDLKAVLQAGTTGGLPEKLALMEQAAAGVGFVHRHGLVHRDLKPANIHVDLSGRVRIMDFGLVRLGDSQMTATGAVMGSPAYMSPEQLRGERVDVRSDVFSLGSVFYELLTGQRAFPGKGVVAIMMSVLTSEPLPLAGVPAPVAAVVGRCLKKDLGQRYQSAGELHAALEVLRQIYG